MKNDYISHFGVSKRNGAKVGSGRYPLGSGENPHQHDGQNAEKAARANEVAKADRRTAIGAGIGGAAGAAGFGMLGATIAADFALGPLAIPAMALFGTAWGAIMGASVSEIPSSIHNAHQASNFISNNYDAPVSKAVSYYNETKQRDLNNADFNGEVARQQMTKNKH